ncbi:MAG: LacI family DNA-binding transcriptional regulator [Actinomycetota bacterium]
MVTQKDVAKQAGVSSATVSAVVNNNKFVSPKLRKKVLQAIEDLNYEVNSIARSLKSKKTYTIGVIVGNVLSYFYSVIAKSVEDTAKKYGYNIILCNGDDDPAEELKYLKVLKSNRVDGIILTPTGKVVDYINHILKTGTNLVLIDRIIDSVKCDSVIVDNFNGAYEAVKHLIDNGYKKIAIINGYIDRTTGKQRLEGYLRALKDSGLKVNNDLIKIGTFKKKSGLELSKELIERNRPEAIFTANLDITMGAIKTIKQLGLKIPEDIAILGFDDSEWSGIADPPVTCVRQPTYNLGKTATELLIERIDKKGKVTNLQNVVLKTELIIRGSSGMA